MTACFWKSNYAISDTEFTSAANLSYTVEQWLNLARSCTVSVEPDGETSAVLSDAMKKSVEGSLPVWYGVTDLVNPARKYYDVKHPEVPDDPELTEKFRHGNRIHDLAYRWFRGLPGAVFREVEVTGEDLGISGLKGRLDFSLQNNIVEFKTTTHGIFSENDVIEKNPQDLEQLVAYSLLTAREREEHFLVYHSGDFEGSFRVFNVGLRNPDALAEVVKQRMLGLRHAIESDDPTSLGRCRYFGYGCKFQSNGVCSCESLAPLDTEYLREGVTIRRNREMEQALREQEAKASEDTHTGFSLWDLVTPRKAYLRARGMLEIEETQDDDTGDIMKHSKNAEFNSPFYAERRELLFRGFSLGYVTMLSVVQKKEDGSETTRIYPSTVRINHNDPSKFSADSISPYYLLRLAMICSIAGSDTGYLVVGFNAEKGMLKSYRITFRNLAEIRSGIEDRISELERSIGRHSPESLPECPRFLHSSCGTSCLCGKPAS